MSNKDYKRVIRFTQDELYHAQMNAKKCDMTLSSYVRSIVNGRVPKEKPDPEFYDLLKLLYESVSRSELNGCSKEYTDKVYDCIFEIEKKYLKPDKL